MYIGTRGCIIIIIIIFLNPGKTQAGSSKITKICEKCLAVDVFTYKQELNTQISHKTSQMCRDDAAVEKQIVFMYFIETTLSSAVPVF